MTRVLVVDDERTLLRALAMNLTARGFEVIEADNGTRALSAAAAREPDVVILDLGLPDISGMDVIRGLRAYSTTPIIVLSARTGSSDKVTALDLGADDYVTKPFSIDELLARLRAATRRAGINEAIAPVRIGSTLVDLDAKLVTDSSGDRIHLTPTEWHLLEALVRRPGMLVTGRALLTELRGTPDHTDPSYLRIYMAQLRRKLEPEPSRPRHLLTEPGMGYRFQP
ncbi:MAG TPA: response regulator [Jatrophihabitantaceae bacterium]|jgi:two-component system KDP operon response regulator KdpE|nr:response regulator [Jatrophihabitantaceae bacterium]